MQTILRPLPFYNRWASNGHEITLIRFYDSRQLAKVVLAECSAGYLPCPYGGVVNQHQSAAEQITEITSIANRRREDTGMREGGHFTLAGVLYLDLKEFPAYELVEEMVSSGCGINYYAEGIRLTFTPWRALEEQPQVTCFLYNQGKQRSERTPLADNIRRVKNFLDEHVSGSTHSQLTENDVERLINNRADFIKLLGDLK